ncbi:MAG: hypothetical protein ABIF87_02100 [Pseudomonadota bacterium]
MEEGYAIANAMDLFGVSRRKIQQWISDGFITVDTNPKSRKRLSKSNLIEVGVLKQLDQYNFSIEYLKEVWPKIQPILSRPPAARPDHKECLCIALTAFDSPPRLMDLTDMEGLDFFIDKLEDEFIDFSDFVEVSLININRIKRIVQEVLMVS